jgi:hypothetical protein
MRFGAPFVVCREQQSLLQRLPSRNARREQLHWRIHSLKLPAGLKRGAPQEHLTMRHRSDTAPG